MSVPGATRVLELGRRIELQGGSSAVLLLHGWTGFPGRLAPLAARLHDAGHTVIVPRLPGHGTSIADMLLTDADDWLRRAIDEYLDLQSRFETVHVAGTSMGAILAALIAARFDVKRVALLAPAFINRNRLIVLAPLLKRLVPRTRGDWDESAESDPRAAQISREYSTYNSTAMAAELLRLQRLGRRALPQLTAETLVIVSRADATVPFEVAELIRTRSNASRFATVAVDRSNHHLAEHVDRRLVADAVVDWFADRD